MDFNLKNIGKSIAGVLLEEEHVATPAKPSSPENVPVSQPSASLSTVSGSQPELEIPTMSNAEQVSAEASGQNEAYTRLKSKVSFETTTAYNVLQKYLAPMAGIAIPEQSKYQVALGQIKSLEHMEPSQLLATFDGLKVSLETEKSKFASYIERSTKALVQPVTENIALVQSDIAKLQQQLQDKTAELGRLSQAESEAKAKIARAEAQFNTAVLMISTEIEGDRTKYSGLLQG
jgi:hypothetical protein